MSDTPDRDAPPSRSLLSRFLNEEQDPDTVEDVHRQVQPLLTRGETISYIAVQQKPIVNIHPECVVLTTRRFMLYKPRLLGRVEFEDYIWRDLGEVTLREGVMGATLGIRTVEGKEITVEYLPKAQARRLYAVAQEMEERAREERRQRELEEKRAAAGGITFGGAHPTPAGATTAEDPVARLRQLKDMLDAGLITAAEYQEKKADILSRM